MKLTDFKLGNYAVSIAALPDRVTGRAAWLKAMFDARTDGEVKTCHNGALEALESDAGAGLIGGRSRTGEAATVQQHMSSDQNPHGVTAAQVGAYTRAETESAISRRVFAAGSADMTRAVYDPRGIAADIYDYVDRAVAAALGQGGESR